MDLRKPQSKSKVLLVYKLLLLAFVIALMFTPKTLSVDPEIEQKLLITTIGIDKEQSGYAVTATAVMPEEGQDGTTMRLTVGGKGESVSRALEDLSLKMGKRLELGLCGLVVVGNTFEDENLLPHLSYLLSSGKIIPGAYMLTADMPASKVVELSNKLSAASSNGLSKLIEHNAIGTSMPAVTLLKFLSDTGSASKAAYLPIITIEEKQQGSGGSQGGGQSGSQNGGQSGGSGSEGEAEITAMNTMRLYRDGKHCGDAGETATRGYAWTDDRSTQGLIQLDDLTIGEQSVGQIYSQLRNKTYKLKTSLRGGVAVADVYITAELELEDRHKLSNLYKYNGISEEALQQALTDEYGKLIEKEILTAAEEFKAAKCDVMLIEDELYRRHYKQYKKLSDKESLFENAVVNVHPTVKFR